MEWLKGRIVCLAGVLLMLCCVKCGNGQSDDSKPKPQLPHIVNINVVAEVPFTLSANVDLLVAQSPFDSKKLSKSGTAGLLVNETASQIIVVSSPSGNPYLMSIEIEPSPGALIEINSRTTAETMVFMVPGIAQSAPEVAREIKELIWSLPEMEGLVSVLDQKLAQDYDILAADDQDIIDALNAVVLAYTQQLQNMTSADAPAQLKKILPYLQRLNSYIVTPPTRQSGVTITQNCNTAPNEITVTNDFNRYVSAYQITDQMNETHQKLGLISSKSLYQYLLGPNSENYTISFNPNPAMIRVYGLGFADGVYISQYALEPALYSIFFDIVSPLIDIFVGLDLSETALMDILEALNGSLNYTQFTMLLNDHDYVGASLFILSSTVSVLLADDAIILKRILKDLGLLKIAATITKFISLPLKIIDITFKIENVAELTRVFIDAARSKTTETFYISVCDFQIPIVFITSPTSGSSWTTSNSPLTLGGTASDDVRVDQVSWQNSAGGSGLCSGTTNWNCNFTLVTGMQTITITANDSSNKTGIDTLTVTYTPSDFPPTVTITSPTSGSNWTTSATPLTVAGNATDDHGISLVSWSSSGSGSGSCSGTTNWSCLVSLVSGSQTVTITARDTANQTGMDTLSVTYNPPADPPPSIAITSPTTGSSYTASATPLNLAGTASDNIGVTQVTWSNSAGGSGSCSGTTSWSCSVPLFDGSQTVMVTARDTANNTATDTLVVSYSAPAQSQCEDGLDNDGDTFTDYPTDSGCSSAADVSEYGSNQCDDGLDNDGDGLYDWPDDTDCTSITGTNESTPCMDGDLDGFTSSTCGGTDCQDGDNTIHPGATEYCDIVRDSNCNGLTDFADNVCDIKVGSNFYKAYRVKLVVLDTGVIKTAEGHTFMVEWISDANQDYGLVIDGQPFLDRVQRKSYYLDSQQVIYFSLDTGSVTRVYLIVGSRYESTGFDSYYLYARQGETVRFTSSQNYDETQVSRVSDIESGGQEDDLILWNGDAPTELNENNFNDGTGYLEYNTTGLANGTYGFGVMTGSPNEAYYEYLAFGKIVIQ